MKAVKGQRQRQQPAAFGEAEGRVWLPRKSSRMQSKLQFYSCNFCRSSSGKGATRPQPTPPPKKSKCAEGRAGVFWKMAETVREVREVREI